MKRTTSLFLLVLFFYGCEQGPPEIRLGRDACDHCQMTIVDEMYPAALVTAKGQVKRFDSIECLAAGYLANGRSGKGTASLWVTDFEHAGTLIPLDSAFLVQADLLHSPMSLNYSAHSDPVVAADVARLYRGRRLEWEELVYRVREEWNLGEP